MRNLLKSLSIVLAVPVLATAVSMFARADWDSRWSATLVRQLAAQRMRPDDRLLARYSLAVLCSDPRTSRRMVPCRTYNLYSAVIRASAIVGAAGLGLLGAFAGAGHLYRTRRRRLAGAFRPALVAAAVATAVVAAANALLALAGILAGTAFFLGEPIERASTSSILVVGTAAVVWAVGMVTASLSVTRRPALTIVGRLLTPAGQPGLAEEVRGIAAAVGAEAPANLVACLEPSVFVTGLRVANLDGITLGPTLCLSLPLCRVLSVAEFRALVAHELAHYSSGGAAGGGEVTSSHSVALRELARLGRQSHGIRAAGIWPPATLLSLFLDETRPGRELEERRELAADAAAASVAGREMLGSALVKVHAFKPAWHAVAALMEHAVAGGTQYVNSSALFEEVVACNAGPERLIGIGRQAQPHPTDHHPPLSRRLTALELELPPVAAAALVSAPSQPAISLVQGYEAIERDLSRVEHRLMVETGGEFGGAASAGLEDPAGPLDGGGVADR